MWEIGIVHQLTSSGYAIAVGILFAAVYDVLKACCIVFKANNFWVFVKDIVFSLFAFFASALNLSARLLVFAFTAIKIAPYIIVNGMLGLIYATIVYKIIKTGE